MVMVADKKSSLVQIAQATLDEATQSVKVAVTIDGSPVTDTNPLPVIIDSQSIQVDVDLDRTEDSVTAWQGGTWTISEITGTISIQNGITYRNRVRLSYSATNVTTSAWVQLLASVGATAIKEVEIFDSSGAILEIGIGASPTEVSSIYIFPGGNGRVPLQIPANSRISARAISENATSGDLVINFYG